MNGHTTYPTGPTVTPEYMQGMLSELEAQRAVMATRATQLAGELAAQIVKNQEQAKELAAKNEELEKLKKEGDRPNAN